MALTWAKVSSKTSTEGAHEIAVAELEHPRTVAGSNSKTQTVYLGSAMRLAEIRTQVMKGRVFQDDSADLIREQREERTGEV
jgi:hypothetical protein